MNDFIKTLVNYVIEAKVKDYRGDQSAETYRLSRINKEVNPGDPAEKRAATFAQINKDYKEEKRLERAPRGPQTRKKPVEEGAKDIWHKVKEVGSEVSQTGKDVKDAVVGGKRIPKEQPVSTTPAPSGPPKRPKAKAGWKAYTVDEGAQVPAGAKDKGPARPSSQLKGQTKKPEATVKPIGDRAGNAFSRSDWKKRQAAIDAAIDG